MLASQCDASGRNPVLEHQNKPTRNAHRRTGPKNEVTMKKSRIRVVEVHRGDSTVRLDPTATRQPFARKRWKETRQNGVAETRTVSISDQFWVQSSAKHCQMSRDKEVSTLCGSVKRARFQLKSGHGPDHVDREKWVCARHLTFHDLIRNFAAKKLEKLFDPPSRLSVLFRTTNHRPRITIARLASASKRIPEFEFSIVSIGF